MTPPPLPTPLVNPQVVTVGDFPSEQGEDLEGLSASEIAGLVDYGWRMPVTTTLHHATLEYTTTLHHATLEYTRLQYTTHHTTTQHNTTHHNTTQHNLHYTTLYTTPLHYYQPSPLLTTPSI